MTNTTAPTNHRDNDQIEPITNHSSDDDHYYFPPIPPANELPQSVADAIANAQPAGETVLAPEAEPDIPPNVIPVPQPLPPPLALAHSSTGTGPRTCAGDKAANVSLSTPSFQKHTLKFEIRKKEKEEKKLSKDKDEEGSGTSCSSGQFPPAALQGNQCCIRCAKRSSASSV